MTSDCWFRYPKSGDPMPPSGTTLLLLTRSGVCMLGQWIVDGYFVAWAPLPARDAAKEAAL